MFHPDLVPNRKHLFDKQNIANVYQTMFDKHCLINNVKGRLRVSGQERLRLVLWSVPRSRDF